MNSVKPQQQLSLTPRQSDRVAGSGRSPLLKNVRSEDMVVPAKVVASSDYLLKQGCESQLADQIYSRSIAKFSSPIFELSGKSI